MPLGTIGEMADATGEYSGDWANSPDEESLDAESVVRAAANRVSADPGAAHWGVASLAPLVA